VPEASMTEGEGAAMKYVYILESLDLEHFYVGKPTICAPA